MRFAERDSDASRDGQGHERRDDQEQNPFLKFFMSFASKMLSG